MEEGSEEIKGLGNSKNTDFTKNENQYFSNDMKKSQLTKSVGILYVKY